MIYFIKRYRGYIITALSLFILVIGIVVIYDYKHPPVSVEIIKLAFKVLSINDNILDGELFGGFFNSSGGYIRDDKIVVGVKYTINGVIYLDDFSLYRSEVYNIIGGILY